MKPRKMTNGRIQGKVLLQCNVTVASFVESQFLFRCDLVRFFVGARVVSVTIIPPTRNI